MPSPPAHAVATSLLALVAAAVPLAVIDRGRLLALAGAGPVAAAALPAVGSLALGAYGARWRHAPLVALGLAAAALAAAPLPLHAVIPRALGRLVAVPFGVHAELFTELYAAAAVGATFSAGAALAASARADALRPAAVALVVFATVRALAAGASSLALHRAPLDAPARLALAASVGWGGALAGAALLARALRSPPSRAAGALVGVTLALARALDESALRAWSDAGRPDLTAGLRLPVLRGAPRVDPPPEVHLVAARGRLLTPGGRRLPRDVHGLASWMSVAANRRPPPRPDEGGDVRCAGAAIVYADLVVAADASLPPADLAVIVAAAEEAAVSTVAFVARLDDAPPDGPPRRRLARPAVTTAPLSLSPLRRACPRPMARARLAPLPALPLDALLRAHGGRGDERLPAGRVLFTTRPAAP